MMILREALFWTPKNDCPKHKKLPSDNHCSHWGMTWPLLDLR
jgi:hypothetical protein